MKLSKSYQRIFNCCFLFILLISFLTFPLYLTNKHLEKFDLDNLKESGIQIDLDIIWNKAFGGTGIEYGESIIKTKDGGFAIVGRTNSTGAGDYDIFVLKLDQNGNYLWNRTLGGQYIDYGYQIVECSNGDLTIIGDHQFNSNNWAYDVYLARIDQTGNILRWNYTFGSTTSQEMGRSLYITNNSHFLLGGVYPISGLESEIWLIRTDSFGNHLWNKTFGGNETDRIFQNNLLIECKNGDIVMGGYTISFGSGQSDIWLIKTDAFGNIIWNKTFGGSELDRPQMLQACDDGGFIICANTKSYGEGDLDLFIIKTDDQGNLLWNFTLGCETFDEGRSIVEMEDGGYIIAGSTGRFGSEQGNLWLIKSDNEGNILGETAFGESYGEVPKAMLLENQTSLLFCGKTEKTGTEDIWVIKVGLNINQRSTNNAINGYDLFILIMILNTLGIIIALKKKYSN